MCLSWYRRPALDDSSGTLLRKLVAVVIDTALCFFEVELSVVAVTLYERRGIDEHHPHRWPLLLYSCPFFDLESLFSIVSVLVKLG